VEYENSKDKHVGAFETCDGKVEDIGHRIMFMLNLDLLHDLHTLLGLSYLLSLLKVVNALIKFT
jgi:hypothetical protein